MKRQEKLTYLKENHFGWWITTRRRVFRELSEKQEIMCCCGNLATSLHETHCRRFNAKVDTETIKRLSHLLPNT